MKHGYSSKYIASVILITVIILVLFLPDDNTKEGFVVFEMFSTFNSMRRKMHNTFNSTKDKIKSFFHKMISDIKGVGHKFTSMIKF